MPPSPRVPDTLHFSAHKTSRAPRALDTRTLTRAGAAVPGHLLPGGVQEGGVGADQDGVEVAGDEVPRDLLQVEEHGLQPLANLRGKSLRS